MNPTDLVMEFPKTNGGYKVKIYRTSTGIYTLGMDSAIGKSRLCSLLKTLASIGEPVRGYDYKDFKANVSIEGLKEDGIKLVMFDRYDMYNGAFAKDIIEMGKNRVVLLDCKTGPKLGTVSYCRPIEMGQRAIEIY